MVADGQVSDYTTTRIQSIAATFASAASISTSNVIVQITPGSVVIQVKLIVESAATASNVTSGLQAQISTPETASTFLANVAGGGVSVLSAPVIVAAAEDKVEYPPPPPPPPPPSPP